MGIYTPLDGTSSNASARLNVATKTNVTTPDTRLLLMPQYIALGR